MHSTSLTSECFDIFSSSLYVPHQCKAVRAERRIHGTKVHLISTCLKLLEETLRNPVLCIPRRDGNRPPHHCGPGCPTTESSSAIRSFCETLLRDEPRHRQRGPGHGRQPGRVHPKLQGHHHHRWRDAIAETIDLREGTTHMECSVTFAQDVKTSPWPLNNSFNELL